MSSLSSQFCPQHLTELVKVTTTSVSFVWTHHGTDSAFLLETLPVGLLALSLAATTWTSERPRTLCTEGAGSFFPAPPHLSAWRFPLPACASQVLPAQRPFAQSITKSYRVCFQNI